MKPDPDEPPMLQMMSSLPSQAERYLTILADQRLLISIDIDG